MKKNLTILSCLSYFVFFAQNNRFIYEYNFIKDTLQKKNTEVKIMFLDINNNKSIFYDAKKYISDSTIVEKAKNNQFEMPPANANFIDYRIEKTNTSLLFVINDYNNRVYVNDERIQNWRIENKLDTLKGYNVQKATTIFGGRKWEAWFAKDIPISDGPYKFKGLPGLILKVQDNTHTHKFQLVGIRNNIAIEEYPIPDKWRKRVNKTNDEYKEQVKNYRKDPAANYRMDVLAGRVYESQDINGNTVTPIQKLRNLEIRLKNEVKNDNNHIELDLLK